MAYRRIYAKIDLDAITKNVEAVRSHIGYDTKLLAVVKADAYGHGAVTIAEHLRDKVDYFGVADMGEALEIRNSGCTLPILVLGYVSPEDYDAVCENEIDVAVFNLTDAEKLSKTAEKLSKKANVHIKIDTGMSRLGFDAETASIKEILQISQLPNICVKGLFSHFANADVRDADSANAQKKLFDDFAEKLSLAGLDIPLKHINNSAAIMRFDEHYDMVRMGIILYGQYPSDDMKGLNYDAFSPAMQIMSHVTFVKTLPAGRGIGYGHTYVTNRETKVATVPVGYADGYNRTLSDKADVLIKGCRCPVIGRVCMDQMMVDVTHLDDVSVGDDVVIVGKDGDEEITVDEIAALAGSFNYEFICGIGRRVPRVYYKNGEFYKEVSYLA